MTKVNDDIESVLENLERADVAANDPLLDRLDREDILRDFMVRCASPIAALLSELKMYREQTEGSTIPIATHRTLVEGYSDESSEKAFSTALEKAAHYFSEEHDVSLTLKQLVALPNGGHRATIEVHITPFTLRPKPHVAPSELQDKHDRQLAFDKFRTQEAAYKRHLIYNHFATMQRGIPVSFVPEYLLINVDDAHLMNYMLERQFFQAGQKPKELSPTVFAIKLSPDPKPAAPHKHD